MDQVKEIEKIIYGVSSALGKPIPQGKCQIIDRGVPHVPKSLPVGKMGIYTFWLDGNALKIGKAGPSSNARFLSQHYNPKSAPSTLAASILVGNKHAADSTPENVGSWIKQHCRRIDILFDSNLGIFTLELIEAALHYVYEPVYEGFINQR
mgnify:CR=1 FL=1